jgi:hypothetical protein
LSNWPKHKNSDYINSKSTGGFRRIMDLQLMHVFSWNKSISKYRLSLSFCTKLVRIILRNFAYRIVYTALLYFSINDWYYYWKSSRRKISEIYWGHYKHFKLHKSSQNCSLKIRKQSDPSEALINNIITLIFRLSL